MKARRELAEKPVQIQMQDLRAILKERDDALKAEKLNAAAEIEDELVPIRPTVSRKRRKQGVLQPLPEMRVKEEEEPAEEEGRYYSPELTRSAGFSPNFPNNHRA